MDMIKTNDRSVYALDKHASEAEHTDTAGSRERIV